MSDSPCRGCGAALVWIKNENGQPEPFDNKPSRVLIVRGEKSPRGAEYDCGGEPFKVERAHLPHFVTCPKALEFKRKKPRKGAVAEDAPPPAGSARCGCGAIFTLHKPAAVGVNPVCPICETLPPASSGKED